MTVLDRFLLHVRVQSEKKKITAQDKARTESASDKGRATKRPLEGDLSSRTSADGPSQVGYCFVSLHLLNSY